MANLNNLLKIMQEKDRQSTQKAFRSSNTGGNNLNNLLSLIGNVARRTATSNTEVGQTIGGIGNLLSERDRGRNVNAFKQELANIIQNEPNPQKQIAGITAIGAKYGGFMGLDDQIENYIDNLTKMTTKTKKTLKRTMLPGRLAPQKVPRVKRGTGEYEGGFLGMGKKEIMAEYPAWNAVTQHVASKISTKEDVMDLVQNRDAYSQAGVDIDTLLQYVEQNMLYKPLKDER